MKRNAPVGRRRRRGEDMHAGGTFTVARETARTWHEHSASSNNFPIKPSPSSSIGQLRISKLVSERLYLMACVITGGPIWLSFRSSVEMLHLMGDAIHETHLSERSVSKSKGHQW